VHALTKTYLSLFLVFVAAFEFWTAMRIFGVKGGAGKKTKVLMRIHRIMGYVFGAYFAWISWVCMELMEKLYASGNYQMDARGALHGLLAMVLLGLWALKVAFIRSYRNYRPYVPLLGFVLVVGTIVLWAYAGWLYLFITGGTKAVGG